LWIYTYYKEEGKPVEIVVLQPNIDPYSEKYTLSNRETITLLLRLTQEEISKNTHFVFTPETVISQEVNNLNDIFDSKETDSFRSFLKRYPQLNWVIGVSIFQVINDKDTGKKLLNEEIETIHRTATSADSLAAYITCGGS